MTGQHKARRDALRSAVREALTSQQRDGSGAIELSHILDQSASAIVDALLPRDADRKAQARVVLGARLLARGLAILADTLEAEQIETAKQIAELAQSTEG